MFYYCKTQRTTIYFDVVSTEDVETRDNGQTPNDVFLFYI